jgi:hypothetical protein
VILPSGNSSAITACVAGLGLAGAGEDESDEDADGPYTQLGKENAGVNVVEVFKKVQELGIEKSTSCPGSLAGIVHQ